MKRGRDWSANLTHMVRGGTYWISLPVFKLRLKRCNSRILRRRNRIFKEFYRNILGTSLTISLRRINQKNSIWRNKVMRSKRIIRNQPVSFVWVNLNEDFITAQFLDLQNLLRRNLREHPAYYICMGSKGANSNIECIWTMKSGLSLLLYR